MDVTLRPLRDSDAETVGTLIADGDIALWNPMSSDDPAAWIAEVAEDDETSATFAIVEKSSDRFLGTASIFSIDHKQGTAQVGYRVLPEERGRGVATGALRALVSHAFEALGVRRIELFHAVANPASCVVAERAGFLLEGVLRQSYVYGDGAAYDEHLHARLATD